MNNKELADKLDLIASDTAWSGDALYDAEHHNVTTFNDRIVIRRFIHGIPKEADCVRLREIASYIREAK